MSLTFIFLPTSAALLKAEMPLEDCSLCCRGYHQLSQHLRIMHKVLNVKERKLLLTISSGRVNVRKGTYPVPGCKKNTSRLDRHLNSNTEQTKVARRDAMQACKRKKDNRRLGELEGLQPGGANGLNPGPAGLPGICKT